MPFVNWIHELFLFFPFPLMYRYRLLVTYSFSVRLTVLARIRQYAYMLYVMLGVVPMVLFLYVISHRPYSWTPRSYLGSGHNFGNIIKQLIWLNPIQGSIYSHRLILGHSPIGQHMYTSPHIKYQNKNCDSHSGNVEIRNKDRRKVRIGRQTES